MKLGKYHIPFTAQETFKGYVDVSSRPAASGPQKYNIGELSWRDRCIYFDALFENHGLAKSIATTIAGQGIAEGIFTVENDRIHGTQSKAATDAKDEIDAYNEKVGMEQLAYEAFIRIVKHGSVFLEQDISNWDLRIIPFQETIEPAEQDSVGEITDWRQIISNAETARWNIAADEIIPVSWNISGKSWPYGTSLYTGLDVDFETLQQLKLDIKEYMHNNAFPMEIFAVGDGQFMPTGDDLAVVRSFAKVMQPGQKMVTSYPINHQVGGTGDREVKGMDTVLNFIKEEIIDGGGIPPISKQWNATMASAKEMMPWTMANYIVPLQRILRREIEEHVYKPYLESLGYSRRICPKLLFTPPDAHKIEEAQFWNSLISAGLPKEYAFEELGFDLDHIAELEAENQKKELEKLKLAQALMPQQQGDATGKGAPRSVSDKFNVKSDRLQAGAAAETYDEWTVRRRKPSQQ